MKKYFAKVIAIIYSLKENATVKYVTLLEDILKNQSFDVAVLM